MTSQVVLGLADGAVVGTEGSITAVVDVVTIVDVVTVVTVADGATGAVAGGVVVVTGDVVVELISDAAGLVGTASLLLSGASGTVAVPLHPASNTTMAAATDFQNTSQIVRAAAVCASP